MAKKTKSNWDLMAKFARRLKNEVEYDSGVHVRSGSDFGYKAYITVTFDDRFQWDDDVLEGQTPIEEDSELSHWIHRLQEMADAQGWEFNYRTCRYYNDENLIPDGIYNDCLAKLTLTCDYSGDYKESTTRRQSVKWKLYKESVDRGPGVTCKIILRGRTPEEVIQNLHEELLNIDAKITDGNEGPNPKLIQTYNKWDDENEGDVMFKIYKSPNAYAEIYSGQYNA
jgi:hypothetical protein